MSGQQPDYPAALASLQHMDIDALKDILNNEDNFNNFVSELPQIKNLEAEKEMLMTSNKSLAEYNMSQEPAVKERKERLLEKFQAATSLAERVKALKAEIDNKSGSMTPDSLLILLEAANQEAEEESETMIELFMDDQARPLQEFMDSYKEKRKLAHLRRIKIDKMRELLNNKQNNPSRPAPPPPNQYNSAGTRLPYPSVGGGPGYPPVNYPALPTPSYPVYPPTQGSPAYPPAQGYHATPPYR